MNPSRIDRRAAVQGLLGLGGGLALAGSAAGEAKLPAKLDPAAFYDAAGKFDEAAAKKAYLDMATRFGYPLNERIRKDLYVTDFALGRFTEVGLACVVWIDEKKWNYASLEVFLLPDQMIPEHWHVPVEADGVGPKMEGWVVRYGLTFTYAEGEPTKPLAVRIHEKEKPFVTVFKQTALRPGEVTSVSKPLEKHWQQAGPEGCILTEMSTYHTGAAVRFTNPSIKF